MTMRAMLAALLTLSIGAAAHGACTNIVTVNSGIDSDSVAGAVFITLDGQCGQTIPTIKAGDDIQIVSGGKQFQADTTNVVTSTPFTRIEGVAGGPAAEDAATLEQLKTSDAATVTIDSATFQATIVNPTTALLNITRYSWSIGPATTSESSSSSSSSSGSGDAPQEGAFRLQYNGEIARPGLLGRNANAKFQSIATLSIDTTNSDNTSYVDNNVLTAGIQSVQLPNSSLFAQAAIGVEGRYTKSFHQDAHDLDAVATFSTWIPVLPSKTIFSNVAAYISPPLSIDVSYGYRNKVTPGSVTSKGRTGSASASYYLYAFDNYQLTLSGTWTLNDLSDRPATVARTGRLYKIQVAYLSNPANGFEVVTSFENGKIGPLMTQVREYYVGMAIKKFARSGGSKSQ